MFILIFEDGTIRRKFMITDNEINAADDGYISIIDIDIATQPKVYISGEWELIEEAT